MRRVVILGAGVTGLSAAERLADLGGCEVTVVEAKAAPGGLAATVRRGSVATDYGPHRLHTEIPEVRSLIPQLVGDDLLTVRRSSRMWLAGRWIPYPLQAREVLRALGPGKVLQVAVGLAAAHLRGLIPREKASHFEDAMSRAYGAAAFRLVFGPYARKVWRADPRQLSEAIARVRLPDRGILAAFGSLLPGKRGKHRGPVRQFHYVRGGIGRLSQALVERVEKRGGRVLLNSRAVDLRFGASGVSAVELQQPDNNKSLACDALISTIPLPEFGRMIPGIDPGARAALGRLRYLSIILVVLEVARDRIGPDHWLYFPEDSCITTRACEPKNFDDSMMPPGTTCLCCEITCRPDEPLYRIADAAIARQVRREMVQTRLLRDDDIRDTFVIRKDWAYPVYTLGFEKELEIVMRQMARTPNVITAGRQGLFNHNNIDHCMVMGRRAAETVTKNPAPARTWYDNLDQFSRFRIFD